MRKYSFLFLFIAFALQTGQAQQELFLASQPEHTYGGLTNPALWPKSKSWFLGLPGLAIDAGHSGSITFNDFISRSGKRRFLNMDALIEKLEAQNTGQLEQRTETLMLGFKLNKQLGFTLHHAIRTNLQMQYPKELIQLFWQGNAQFIGETVVIEPKLRTSGFNEFGFNARWHSEKWSFGTRIKYFSGIGLVETERFKATINTDSDIYQLTLGSDISLISVGAIERIDTTASGFDVEIVNFDRSKLFSANSGVGFDLGVSYKFSEKLRVSASLTDVGAAIKWKRNVKQFESNGSYKYDGVFFDGNILLNDNGQVDIKAQLDTLREVFHFTSKSTSLTQKLPWRFYTAAQYKATQKLDVGFVASTSQKTGIGEQAYGVGASVAYQVKNWFRVGTQLSTTHLNAIQAGVLATAKLGPAQFYLVSDDVASAFIPKARPTVQFRYGFALLF